MRKKLRDFTERFTGQGYFRFGVTMKDVYEEGGLELKIVNWLTVDASYAAKEKAAGCPLLACAIFSALTEKDNQGQSRQEEKARFGGREFVRGSEMDWHDI